MGRHGRRTGDLCIGCGLGFWRRYCQQLPLEGDFGGTLAVGEEPVVADAMEAIG